MASYKQSVFLSRSAQAFGLFEQSHDEPDAVLLARFIEQWDHVAFGNLVRRHGPMVMGVCCQILREPHAAEDAFQATFMLLVRKAASVRKRESVAAWLFGVARRVALEARGVSARLSRSRVVMVDAEGANEVDTLERCELHATVHAELDRLPEKYREPLVLCYIEGLTHESVARKLAWPIGTVRVRIARGRDLLRSRLLRRGVTSAGVLLALSLLSKAAGAIPARLVDATVRAGARAAAGENVPRGDVAARVVDLETKVRKAMHLEKLKWATTLALVSVISGAAVVTFVPRALAAVDDAEKRQSELKKLQGTWKFALVERAGERKEPDGDAEQLEIEGEAFSIRHGGHVEEKGKIKLDVSKTPMHIDFQFEDGKHKGVTDLAIYAWDGEKLKVSWIGGADRHPTEFTTKDVEKQVLVILKR